MRARTMGEIMDEKKKDISDKMSRHGSKCYICGAVINKGETRCSKHKN